MKEATVAKPHKTFAEILAIIIADLQEANSVLVPEVLVLLRSIEKFTTNDKVKAILD